MIIPTNVVAQEMETEKLMTIMIRGGQIAVKTNTGVICITGLEVERKTSLATVGIMREDKNAAGAQTLVIDPRGLLVGRSDQVLHLL